MWTLFDRFNTMDEVVNYLTEFDWRTLDEYP